MLPTFMMTEERIVQNTNPKKQNKLSRLLKRVQNPPHYYYKKYPEGTLITKTEKLKSSDDESVI